MLQVNGWDALVVYAPASVAGDSIMVAIVEDRFVVIFKGSENRVCRAIGVERLECAVRRVRSKDWLISRWLPGTYVRPKAGR